MYIETGLPLFLILTEYKKKFHQVILEALETGPMTREELKILYRAENIGVEEEKQVFNAWGGSPSLYS